MCGIFGIVSTVNVASKIPNALKNLQHRGEQGCGLAVSDGSKINAYQGLGLVTQVFDDKNSQEIIESFPGKYGIGHTLYSTVGEAEEAMQTQTLQPLFGTFNKNEVFAVAHNGNLINLYELRDEAERNGYKFKSKTSDTEVIVALLSTSEETDFLKALLKVLPRLEGSFALTILFKDKVIGVQDKHGIRPLWLGFAQDSTSFILASEDCVFHQIGANSVREIGPGEIIVLGRNGIEKENSFIWADSPERKICIFEYVYFARPDSTICGQTVYSYRKNASQILAKEQPVEAEIATGTPDSGNIYDIHYAQASGIPLEAAIYRNRYIIGRLFITPRGTDRRTLLRFKLHVLGEVVHGKRVCIIDDSIVRANVMAEVASMLREQGATEVHVRIGSSPICFPCFLGIDMHTLFELIAANFLPEEIQKRILQVDSQGHLSIEGMIRASGLPRENLCLGCFTGEYPIKPPEGMIS